jgi:hypothetical protein
VSAEQAIDPSKLSEGTRAALAEVARLLISGFTGSIELNCVGGAVRTIKDSRQRQPSDLPSLAGETSGR